VDAGASLLTRRSLLLGAGSLAAGLVACTGSTVGPGPSGTAEPSPTSSLAPAECGDGGRRAPLWQRPIERGLVYGSSAATWQLSDPRYRRLFEREAAILFTEDDLLWYRLKPTPDSDLDFRYGDRIVGFAERSGMLVLGAHLVWDSGFGDGWTEDDLYAYEGRQARDLLLGTIDAVVGRYRGRVAAWIVVNEALDGFGIRPEVPWYATIGPTYVEESFHAAHEADPDAMLLLNDFGYETGDQFSSPEGKRTETLTFLDELLDADVPIHAFGVQAHLDASFFPDGFDAEAYRRFLAEIADRGLRILITEMDVLDDGLPKDVRARDRAVADVYARYLDVALDEPAVASLVTFGLSDRYTWLQEDYPREDGVARRPLPFDEEMRPKAAFASLARALDGAAVRDLAWLPPRC
jgi:endo-1,4-beta-xylanase